MAKQKSNPTTCKQKYSATYHCSILEKYVKGSSISRCTGARWLLGLGSTSEQTADHVDEEHTN